MPNPNNGLVVIVEDDQSVRKALTRILRMAGWRSITYGSAEDLLADGNAHGAACLILDVQLPGLTGFDLHDRLRQMGTSPPVIFITAFDEPEARERASRAGAVDFLAKPFAGKRLVDTVSRAVAGIP